MTDLNDPFSSGPGTQRPSESLSFDLIEVDDLMKYGEYGKTGGGMYVELRAEILAIGSDSME